MFWLETKEYAYALQRPVDSYRKSWKAVVQSWREALNLNGTFCQISHTGPKPVWWTTKRDWDALLLERAKPEGGNLEDALASEGKHKQGRGVKQGKETTGKGKGKAKAGTSNPRREEAADVEITCVAVNSRVLEREAEADDPPKQGSNEEPRAAGPSSAATEVKSVKREPHKRSRFHRIHGIGLNDTWSIVKTVGTNGKCGSKLVVRPMTQAEIKERNSRKAAKKARRVAEAAARLQKRYRRLWEPRASTTRTSQPTGSKRKADVLASGDSPTSGRGERSAGDVSAPPSRSNLVGRAADEEYRSREGRAPTELDGCVAGPSAREAARVPEGPVTRLLSGSSPSAYIGPQIYASTPASQDSQLVLPGSNAPSQSGKASHPVLALNACVDLIPSRFVGIT